MWAMAMSSLWVMMAQIYASDSPIWASPVFTGTNISLTCPQQCSLLSLLTTISSMQLLNCSVSVGKVAHHDEVHICREKKSLGPFSDCSSPVLRPRRAGHVSGGESCAGQRGADCKSDSGDP